MKNYNKMYDEPEFTGTAEIQEDIIEIESDIFDETPSVVLATEDFSDEPLGSINAREVYLREGPEKYFDPVGTVKIGEIVTVLGRDGDFLKVRTQDGLEAYIMKSFVTID